MLILFQFILTIFKTRCYFIFMSYEIYTFIYSIIFTPILLIISKNWAKFKWRVLGRLVKFSL